MLPYVVVVLALGLASSASLLSPFSSSARQLQIDPNDLPATCRSVCDEPVNVLNTYNSDFDVLCRQSILHGYAECMSCLIEDTGAVSVSQAQAAVDGLVDGCNALGYSVSEETVSGGSGDSTTRVTTGPPSPTGSTFPTSSSPLANDDTGGHWDDDLDEDEDSLSDGIFGDVGDGALATVQSAGLVTMAVFSGAAFVFFA